MADEFDERAASRRAFLKGSAAAVGGAAAFAAAGRAGAAEGDPLILEVQEWASATGVGVDAVPYGMPIKYEADVIRRWVPWLTASPLSSVNFTPIYALDGTITPQGCAFERHHSGAIELSKADYRLMINGLVETPLVFTYEDLERFPRENHIYFLECAANTGMEWRGAQLNGAQFTHGMIHNMEYTGVPLRTLLA
ncbi:MAG: sulfite dehydrogenase, partial [Alphaproteobacteria bacterium]